MVLIWNRRRSTSLEGSSCQPSFIEIAGLSSAVVRLQWICDTLCNCTRDGTCTEFPNRRRILLALRCEVLSHTLVDHEVQADVRGDAGNRGNDATVERPDAALGLVHVRESLKHARQFLRRVLSAEGQGLERGRLDRKARADDVEGVCYGYGGDAGDRTATQSSDRCKVLARRGLEILESRCKHHSKRVGIFVLVV